MNAAKPPSAEQKDARAASAAKRGARRRMALVALVLGGVALLADLAEFLAVSSRCGSVPYCTNLYEIPEVELAIFGVALLVLGLGLLLFRI